MRRSTSIKGEQIEILSTDQQEEVIEELRAQAASQTSTARFCFHVLFLGIALIFVVCIFFSARYPWVMDHQRHFKDILPHWGFQLYYATSAACFMIAALLVKVGNFCMFQCAL